MAPKVEQLTPNDLTAIGSQHVAPKFLQEIGQHEPALARQAEATRSGQDYDKLLATGALPAIQVSETKIADAKPANQSGDVSGNNGANAQLDQQLANNHMDSVESAVAADIKHLTTSGDDLTSIQKHLGDAVAAGGQTGASAYVAEMNRQLQEQHLPYHVDLGMRSRGFGPAQQMGSIVINEAGGASKTVQYSGTNHN